MILKGLGAFLLGLAGGSFVSLVSWRLIHAGPLLAGRSRCPDCRTSLGPRDLVPVLSWMRLKGRCRYCRRPVSPRYPLVETAFGLLLVPAGVLSSSPEVFGATVLILGALLTLVVVDIEERVLPRSVFYVLVPAAAVFPFFLGDAPVMIAVRAAAGVFLAYALRVGYRYVRGREGLGMGDIRLFGVAGAVVPVAMWGAFLVAAGLGGVLTGLLWRARGGGSRFPFAPALCAALYAGLLLRLF